MSKRILLIIDPQKDFTSPTGAYALRHDGITQIRKVVDRLNELLQRELPVPALIVISDYERGQFGTGVSMAVPGTEGHELDLFRSKNFPILHKKQHSCFSSPAVLNFLQKEEIDEVLLAGFLAEYCVRQTAVDALAAGYDVTLLEDVIGTGDDVQERLRGMMEELRKAGAKISDSSILSV